MMGHFNCKEVCWEEWYTNQSESSWGNRLLKLAMDNALTQWISEDTRFSNEGETSRLDLVFSKEPEGTEDINIGCPVAKSGHAALEFNVIEEVEN